MKKLYLLNNIIIGLILVLIWYADYFYLRRSSKKLSRTAQQAYNALSDSLSASNAAGQNTLTELSKVFPYRPKDTFYIDFVNFHKINPQVREKFEQLLKEVYSTRLKNLHELIIYFRSTRVPKGELSSFLQKGNPPFKSAHQSLQNFYQLRIINEDFDNRFNIKSNTVSIFISSGKLNEPETIKRLIAKSLFHLKKLNKLDKIKGFAPKSKDFFDRLKKAYFGGLKAKALNHFESLRYINGNKNLVFLQPYLSELESEAPLIAKAFTTRDLKQIYSFLRKADLAIYDTVYFYEEY